MRVLGLLGAAISNRTALFTPSILVIANMMKGPSCDHPCDRFMVCIAEYKYKNKQPRSERQAS
jgi:hypothetical protein